jgi:GcrA cell cycle regulator
MSETARPQVRWTDAHVDVLSRMHAEGHCLSEISRTLVVFSKSAVGGKARKLGLRFRAPQQQIPWTPTRVAQLKALLAQGITHRAISAAMGVHYSTISIAVKRLGLRTAIADARKPKTSPEAIATAEAAQPTEHSVSFIEIMGRYGRCKWPLRGQGGMHGLVCGCATRPMKPYCDAHSAVASGEPGRVAA